jgi:hypothetical protein
MDLVDGFMELRGEQFGDSKEGMCGYCIVIAYPMPVKGFTYSCHSQLIQARMDFRTTILF